MDLSWAVGEPLNFLHPNTRMLVTGVISAQMPHAFLVDGREIVMMYMRGDSLPVQLSGLITYNGAVFGPSESRGGGQ